MQGWLKLQNIKGAQFTYKRQSRGWQDLFPTYKQCKYLIFKWEGGRDISTTKSISGDIDNHENLINQV